MALQLVLTTGVCMLGDLGSEPFLGLYFDPSGRKFVVPSDRNETKCVSVTCLLMSTLDIITPDEVTFVMLHAHYFAG